MEENKLKNARYIDVKAIIHLLKVTDIVYDVLGEDKRKIDGFFLRINNVIDDNAAKQKAVNHIREKYGADFVQILEKKE